MANLFRAWLLLMILTAPHWAQAEEQTLRADGRASTPAQTAVQADSATASPSSVSARAFGSAQTARVRSVVDGRGFLTSDGREVRIAGIEVPPLPRPGDARRSTPSLDDRSFANGMITIPQPRSPTRPSTQREVSSNAR